VGGVSRLSGRIGVARCALGERRGPYEVDEGRPQRERQSERLDRGPGVDDLMGNPVADVLHTFEQVAVGGLAPFPVAQVPYELFVERSRPHDGLAEVANAARIRLRVRLLEPFRFFEKEVVDTFAVGRSHVPSLDPLTLAGDREQVHVAPMAAKRPKLDPQERFDLVEACRLATPEALERLQRLIRESSNDAAVARACETIAAYGFGRPQTNVKIERVEAGSAERIRLIDHLAENHPEVLRGLIAKHVLTAGEVVDGEVVPEPLNP
jgi:hypothetical protein